VSGARSDHDLSPAVLPMISRNVEPLPLGIPLSPPGSCDLFQSVSGVIIIIHLLGQAPEVWIASPDNRAGARLGIEPLWKPIPSPQVPNSPHCCAKKNPVGKRETGRVWKGGSVPHAYRLPRPGHRV
jgi:hypothetical protein